MKKTIIFTWLMLVAAFTVSAAENGVFEDQVVEYGTKVNEPIVKSNVANDTKETMKVANNIAVNNSLYWGSN